MPDVPSEQLPAVLKAEELCEQAQQCLESGQHQHAVTLLQRALTLAPQLARLHNNLAQCHFITGDVDAALACEQHVLRHLDPHNIYAVGNLIQMLIAVGKEGEARAWVPRLLEYAPPDPTHLVNAALALAQLRAHAELLELARSWNGEPVPMVQFLAGVACLNLGHVNQASQYLQQAVEDERFGEEARRKLKWLKSRRMPPHFGGEYGYLAPFDWLPGPLMDQLLEEASKGDEELWRVVRRWPVLVEVALSLLERSEGRELSAVGMLSAAATPRAIAALRDIAFGMSGPDDLRMECLAALHGLGCISGGEKRKVFLKGSYTHVEVEPEEPLPEREEQAFEIPPPYQAQVDEALTATRAGRWRKAEQLYRELLHHLPTHPWLLHNLAVVLLSGRKDKTQAETLLRKALQVAPHYEYARASLVSILVSQRRLDEARALLELPGASQGAPPEWLAQNMVARAQLEWAADSPEAAVEALEAAEELAPHLQSVKAMAELLAPLRQTLTSTRKRRAWMLKQSSQRRARILEADAPLERCLAEHRREELQQLARSWNVQGVVGANKPILLKAVCARMRERGAVRQLVDRLDCVEQQALRHVMQLDGRVSYMTFAQTYGVAPVQDGNDFVQETPLESLLRCGLLVEATVEGLESVMVPREVREALARTLVA